MSRINLILGVTGSVAAIKCKELTRALVGIERVQEVRIVFTTSAKKFVSRDDVREIQNELGVRCYDDDDEWADWGKVGDPVTHVDLAKWADVLLIAPLSANTLAKLANGLCDNLLTCLFRAWDLRANDKAIILAPAMNTAMWNSPFTKRHLKTISEIASSAKDDVIAGFIVVQPIEKALACGDYGVGAMAEVSTIAQLVALTGEEKRTRGFLDSAVMYPSDYDLNLEEPLKLSLELRSDIPHDGSPSRRPLFVRSRD